jgi:RimJ/RimL family protein N-acetyltransferase
MSQIEWSEVSLTPLRAADLDQIWQWQNSPDIRDLSMGFRMPVPFENVEDWFSRIRSDESGKRIVFAVRVSGELAGTVELHSVKMLHRKASLAIVLGDLTRQGRNLGFVACSLALDFAFNSLDLRRVELEVVESNMRAVRLYERLGFLLEGRKREDYFAHGRRMDVLVFGLLREEWSGVLPADANRLVGTFDA